MSQNTPTRTVMVQGRIVWVAGDLFKGKLKTDQNTRQPIIDQRTGLQRIEYGFGLAVPKSVLGQTGTGQAGEIWAAIHEEAASLYPSRQIPPNFAMKKKDGDTDVDEKGIPYSQREGYAGCIVFACTTSLSIKYFRNENNQNFLINEGIKNGDYVQVQLSIKAHPASGQGKAGLYLNPNAVLFLGYGKEIINTPSGDQIFGAQAPALPFGASSTPIAPQGTIVPTGQMNMGPPMFQNVPAAPQSFGPPPVTQQPAPAHYGVLPQQHQPPVAPQQNYPQSPQGFPLPGAGQQFAPPPQGAPQFVNPPAPGQFQGQPQMGNGYPPPAGGVMPNGYNTPPQNGGVPIVPQAPTTQYPSNNGMPVPNFGAPR